MGKIFRSLARLLAVLGARAWWAVSAPFQATRLSSITDNGWWSNRCARIAGDGARYARFRRRFVHRVIVEATPASEARQHLARILAQTPHYAALLDKFRAIDRIGAPRTASFGPHGRFAPSTLRYARYLSDCETRFGNLDGASIVEIGIGFGGLCKIAFDRFALERYVLIDLPGPIAMARRFLGDTLGPDLVARRVAFREDGRIGTPAGNFDLAISTLAFSECERSMQRAYTDNILKRARCGYIHWNEISRYFGVNSMRLPELVAALPPPVEVEKDEITYWYDNTNIITWRQSPPAAPAAVMAGTVTA